MSTNVIVCIVLNTSTSGVVVSGHGMTMRILIIEDLDHCSVKFYKDIALRFFQGILSILLNCHTAVP